MIENEELFQVAAGLRLAGREWLPERGSIRGVVFILHGLSEHCGRYRHVAAALTKVGFACYGIDHRGHGKSGGTRAYIADGWLPVADLEAVQAVVRARHPRLPCFAFAHSMGSLIGLGFALRNPGRLQGIATSGLPLDAESVYPSWLVSLCLRVARYLPKLRLSLPGGPSLLTADPAMQREWRRDPLVNRGMWRVGTSAALARLARDIRERRGEVETPLLVMHGAEDRLAPVSGSRRLARAARSGDVTLKIYPAMRHELVNEVERDRVVEDLCRWLLTRA